MYWGKYKTFPNPVVLPERNCAASAASSAPRPAGSKPAPGNLPIPAGTPSCSGSRCRACCARRCCSTRTLPAPRAAPASTRTRPAPPASGRASPLDRVSRQTSSPRGSPDRAPPALSSHSADTAGAAQCHDGESAAAELGFRFSHRIAFSLPEPEHPLISSDYLPVAMDEGAACIGAQVAASLAARGRHDRQRDFFPCRDGSVRRQQHRPPAPPARSHTADSDIAGRPTARRGLSVAH